MPDAVAIRSALPPAELARVALGLLQSPLVAQSTLAGSFRESRGFAVTFTADGREALARRFPFLQPFLACALSAQAHRALEPWTSRVLRRPPPRPRNAFYLNLLLLADGGRVGRHTDATLRGASGLEAIVPEQVSVLYLGLPERFDGGALCLYRKERLVARIRPRVGTLLHFRGDLQHEVTALSAPSGGLRASAVLEQYHLPAQALALLSPMHIQSKAGFAAYLDDRRRSEVLGRQ